VIAGLYVPGESPLHRLDVGVKLLVLMALGIGLILTKSVLLLILVVAVTGLLFAFAAELGLMRLWQTTRPLLIWFVFIAVSQILVANAETAGLIILRLAVLVWAAALVTYTTRLSDMMECLIRIIGWLSPLGVPPHRVAFMIALTIRLIPALSDVVQDVRDAQRARGIENSIIASVVPVLTRVFQQADAMSEALEARGYERWDDQRNNAP